MTGSESGATTPASVTRETYLRSRGWFRFKGDAERWHHRDHHPGTEDGISAEEAERKQDALDEVAAEHLR